MADLAQLEKDLLNAVEGAADEVALETVRVSALGKNGSVSALLKTLGGMAPDERKSKGPAINGLKDKITQAIAAVTRSLRPLISGPLTLRSSGVMPPSVLSSADTEPLLPSADTRTASSAASSAAPWTAPSNSCSSWAMSATRVHSGNIKKSVSDGLPPAWVSMA